MLLGAYYFMDFEKKIPATSVHPPKESKTTVRLGRIIFTTTVLESGRPNNLKLEARNDMQLGHQIALRLAVHETIFQRYETQIFNSRWRLNESDSNFSFNVGPKYLMSYLVTTTPNLMPEAKFGGW